MVTTPFLSDERTDRSRRCEGGRASAVCAENPVSTLPLFPDEQSDQEEVLGFNNRRISPTNSLDQPEQNPYEVAYWELAPSEKRYVDMVNKMDGYELYLQNKLSTVLVK